MGDEPAPKPDPHSSFRLEITLAVGYSRRRPLVAGKWEGPIVSVLLALAGIAVVLIFLLWAFRLNLT